MSERARNSDTQGREDRGDGEHGLHERRRAPLAPEHGLTRGQLVPTIGIRCDHSLQDDASPGICQGVARCQTRSRASTPSTASSSGLAASVSGAILRGVAAHGLELALEGLPAQARDAAAQPGQGFGDGAREPVTVVAGVGEVGIDAEARGRQARREREQCHAHVPMIRVRADRGRHPEHVAGAEQPLDRAADRTGSQRPLTVRLVEVSQLDAPRAGDGTGADVLARSQLRRFPAARESRCRVPLADRQAGRRRPRADRDDGRPGTRALQEM